MASPVYQVFMGKFTEAWYKLSEEEQQHLIARLDEAFGQVGGKHVIMCDSAWASDGTHFWGVDEFPDIEAVQKHVQSQQGINWYRYVDSESILGTKWEQS